MFLWLVYGIRFEFFTSRIGNCALCILVIKKVINLLLGGYVTEYFSI